MSRRGWSVGAAALLFGLLLGWWLLRDWAPQSQKGSGHNLLPAGQIREELTSYGLTPSSPVAPTVLTNEARQQLLRDAPEAHLADGLNLPSGTIQSDVAIVGSMIAAYRSIYNQRGNPIGDNREITDTLLGKNPNGNIFLQAGHRAINAKGELCDRWGTPFSFHATSGTKMEVRSAGPDRTMWTADDVFLVP